MKGKIIGILLLVIVVVAGVLVKHSVTTPTVQVEQKQTITLKGYVGGEKTGLLDDAGFQKILKDKYGVALDYSKAGSLEMVQQDTKGEDFLFPSSQVPLDYFESSGKKYSKTENIFNSPIVFYSWDDITDSLIKDGIVTKSGDTYYVTNMSKLIDAVIQGKKWSDLGINNLYGNVTVITTDPNKSNSGSQFTGLLANVLNGGEVVDTNSVEKVIPKVQQFYSKLGYMNDSSADIFDQYLKTGEGAKPIIVGYESQIIEFSKQNPDAWKNLQKRVRILYPAPTVWSSHPLITLNSQSDVLIKAFQDKDAQTYAWENYGFRSGTLGVQNDMKNVTVPGIPTDINEVVQMPRFEAMDKLLKSISQ